jgi:hypothetical protein
MRRPSRSQSRSDRRPRNNLIHFGAFVGGIAVIVLTRVLLEG